MSCEPTPIDPRTQLEGGVAADGAGNGKGHRGLRRVLVLVAVLVGAVLAVQLSPIGSWLENREVRDYVLSLGVWTYPVFIVAVAALVACGVPRLLICAAGGAIFGFFWGLLLTQVATLMGAYGAFCFIRWGGRDWALHRFPKLRKWAELIHEQGIVGVVLVRQLPLHGTLTNLCLGLSHVKHRHFLIGSAIGLLPEAIPATLVGKALVKTSLRDSVGHFAIAAGAMAVLWIGFGYTLRAMRKSRSGSAGEVGTSDGRG